METARELFVDYLLNVDTVLEAEFQRAARLHTIGLRREGRYDLDTAEVYWEFACPEPLALYRALEPAFKSFRGLVRRRNYVNADITATAAEIVHNCPCWSFSEADGGTLKVYAKTNQRLRVEVAFRVADVPDVNKKCASRIGLHKKIETLRQKAAEQVNELFEHLVDCFPSAPPLPHPGDPLRLLLDFVAVVRKACEAGLNAGGSPEGIAYSLLSVLRENGAIRTPPKSPLRGVVRELVRKSPPFLKCCGRGRGARYMLAPKYRPAFAKLFEELTAGATAPASLRLVPTPPPPGQIPHARPRDPEVIPPARSRE